MTNTTNFITPFASGHSRAQWVKILLLVGVVLDLIAIVSGYFQIDLLSKVMAGQTITEAEAAANDSRQQIIGILQVLAFLTTTIFFLMWFHRAHRNLPALGAHNLRFSPGWAVGYCFIPIVSLYRPYQVAEEIWKASDPNLTDESSWQTANTSPLLGWWWGLFLISGFVGNVVVRMTLRGGQTVSDLLTMSWGIVTSDGLSIVAAILAIFVVKGIDTRQEEKNKRLIRP